MDPDDSGGRPRLDPPPRGVLLDLDGTLYQGNRPVAGAPEAVRRLREAGYGVRFVTNTTRRPRSELVERLRGLGIEADRHELFTAPAAAAARLAERGVERIALCLPRETLAEFSTFRQDEREPEAVVVGDLGDEWTFHRLNRAFRWLLAGAELVALQRNRYWRTEAGLVLDAGPFVAALEYAAGVEATVVGKPSREFFAGAARSMGLDLSEVVMVGDDPAADVGGARAAGARGVLVRTGKFREEELAGSEVRPDAVIDSVAELPALLES